MVDLVRELLRVLTPRERRNGAILFGLMLFGAFLEMIGVGAVPAFVSVLTDPSRVQSSALGRWAVSALGIASPRQLLLWSAGGLLALFLVKNSYLALLTWVRARYVFNRQVGIARRLLTAYLYSPYPFHLRRNTAELLRNTNQDAMQIVGQGLMPLLNLAMEGLTVVAVLVLLLAVEPITSLAAFAILGGSTTLFLRIVRKRMLGIGEAHRAYRRDMLQSVNEGLGGIKITKVLGRERHFLQTFNQASDGFALAGRRMQVLQELPRLILELVAVAGLLSVAALLLAQDRPLSSLIPTLALLAVAVVRMIPSFNRITMALNSLRYGRAAVHGLFEDLTRLEQRPSVNVEPMPFHESIRLDSVSFSYQEAAHTALENIDITIEKGSAVGFIGPTGSGKTTVVDVILGLLAPTAGRVLVDGEDIAGRERAWQAQIGYIPQETYLADATIRQNIAFGLPDNAIDDAAVWRAVDAAQVREFVDRMPHGLETVVGERGVRLSGGQRQRIAIARALYHDPEVLVMDEATSALDDETEQYVMRAIEHLRGTRTILLVAHRLSTVVACDQLFLLRRGKVDKTGTFAELNLEAEEAVS